MGNTPIRLGLFARWRPSYRRRPDRSGDAGKARSLRHCPCSTEYRSGRCCRFPPMQSLRDFLRGERQGPEAAPAPGWASARSISGKPPLSQSETLFGKSFFPTFPPLPPGTPVGGERLQAVPFHHAGKSGKGHVDDPEHAVPRGPVEDSPEKTRRIPPREAGAESAILEPL